MGQVGKHTFDDAPEGLVDPTGVVGSHAYNTSSNVDRPCTTGSTDEDCAHCADPQG